MGGLYSRKFTGLLKGFLPLGQINIGYHLMNLMKFVGGIEMSKSGQEFIAATEGTAFTLYSVMKALGIPLTLEQEKFQAELERRHPRIIPYEEKGEKFVIPKISFPSPKIMFKKE